MNLAVMEERERAELADRLQREMRIVPTGSRAVGAASLGFSALLILYCLVMWRVQFPLFVILTYTAIAVMVYRSSQKDLRSKLVLAHGRLRKLNGRRRFEAEIDLHQPFDIRIVFSPDHFWKGRDSRRQTLIIEQEKNRITLDQARPGMREIIAALALAQRLKGEVLAAAELEAFPADTFRGPEPPLSLPRYSESGLSKR